jgi:hypothetical protein
MDNRRPVPQMLPVLMEAALAVSRAEGRIRS